MGDSEADLHPYEHRSEGASTAEDLHRPLDASKDEEEEDDDTEEEDSMVPNPERQKAVMELYEAQQPEFEAGDLWYLISMDWLRRWRQYVKWGKEPSSTTVPAPGPIDNSDLVDENGRVVQNVVEHSHFGIISKDEWNNLFQWYGGGPTIERKVISTGRYNKAVEIRLLKLHFIKSSEPEKMVTKEFSKVATVKEVLEEMCPVMGVEKEQVRMWDYINKKYSQLLEEDKTLSQSTIIDNQHLMLEEKLASGEWPKHPAATTSYPSYPVPSYSASSSSTSTTTSSYNPSYSWGATSYNRGKEPSDPGVCGLSNLGNTCFMNSSLQCLSNCSILTRYCLTDEYKPDMNTDNPLGTGGKLVEQYASLLKNMWSGEYKYIAPREFKQKLETFAPQFEGMQQHDSQELLAYLLDGLHEDLNRVRKKPFVELKEADGRPDEIVAQEAWDNHLVRNDSVIVDWFLGQLKSTLVCPRQGCDRVSVTFDPTMYLSLPLPVSTTRTMKGLVVVPSDLSALPLKLSLVLPKDGNIGVLKQKIFELTEIPEDKLVVAEIFSNKIYKYLGNKELIENIAEKDVIRVYEVDEPPRAAEKEEEEEEEEEEEPARPYYYSYKPPVPPNPDDVIHLQVILRKREPPKRYYYGGSTESYAVVGQPIVIAVRRGITYEEAHERIVKWLARFVKDPSVLELPPLPEPQETQDAQENTEDAMETSQADNNETMDDASGEQTTSSTAVDGDVHMSENDEQDLDDEAAEDDDGEEEDEDVDEMDDTPEPPFILEVLDTSARRRIRDVGRGDAFDFKDRELLSVTFSEESFAEHYAGPEHEEVKEQDDDDDETCELTDCLKLFITEEQLGPEDAWYCNKCKDHVQATKKFDLWKLPPLLVIHLKRFSYRNRYRRDKLDTLVKFPLEGLDLSEFTLSDADLPCYDLFAVSNHFGALGGGHYTAFAKNPNDEQWYKFDDSHVTPVNEDRVCTSAAYVLFYRRRDATEVKQELKYSPSVVQEEEEEEEEDEVETELSAEKVEEEDEEDEQEEVSQEEDQATSKPDTTMQDIPLGETDASIDDVNSPVAPEA